MFMPEAPRLLAAGLRKSYGQRLAVAAFSLQAMPGELIALAGPNGSGKSTALRMLAGLVKPDSGSGQILGCDLRSLDRSTRNAVGYLPQRAALYANLSIYENLRFRAAVAGLSHPGVVARKSLAALALTARAGTPLQHLSGGWMRRVEIAATLIHEPQLLLLDEPTSGLDSAAREDIWLQIDNCRARGAAVVISSHEADELARATRCVRFEERASEH